MKGSATPAVLPNYNDNNAVEADEEKMPEFGVDIHELEFVEDFLPVNDDGHRALLGQHREEQFFEATNGEPPAPASSRMSFVDYDFDDDESHDGNDDENVGQFQEEDDDHMLPDNLQRLAGHEEGVATNTDAGGRDGDDENRHPPAPAPTTAYYYTHDEESKFQEEVSPNEDGEDDPLEKGDVISVNKKNHLRGQVQTGSSCTNNHRSCQYWASIGECRKKPNYMLSQCSAFCTKHCCYDNNRSCPHWASRGECRRNPNYMLNFCRKSCRTATCSSSGGGGGGGGGSTSQQWVDAHNRRRRKYHAQFEKSYIPVRWSNDIARSAQNYANKLIRISGCRIAHNYQGDRYGGENLAANGGSTSQTPDQVVQRWAENEAIRPGGSWSLNRNGHFTQVVWRATRYIGCGQASKSGCHIQVCRYIRPGNCNMSSSSWAHKTFADSSPCGPFCTREGLCSLSSEEKENLIEETAEVI